MNYSVFGAWKIKTFENIGFSISKNHSFSVASESKILKNFSSSIFLFNFENII